MGVEKERDHTHVVKVHKQLRRRARSLACIKNKRLGGDHLVCSGRVDTGHKTFAGLRLSPKGQGVVSFPLVGSKEKNAVRRENLHLWLLL